MKPSLTLSWDVEVLARSLKIRQGSVYEVFSDGRMSCFIIERRLSAELKLDLVRGRGGSAELLDSKGQKWKPRYITDNGVAFCPSYMLGCGREFNEVQFIHELGLLKAFILCDVVSFPRIPCWVVGSETVKRWYFSGLLGAGSKISRIGALKLLESEPDTEKP